VQTWLAEVLSALPAVQLASDIGILIVDDDASASLYADRVLRGAGYQAVVASGGAEAIQKAAAMARVDLLVTDLMMRGMNGDELARSLRQRDAQMKVLYVTSFSDRTLAARIALRRDDAVIEKPYSATAFERAFSKVAYGRTGRSARPPAYAAVPALWM
jgi:two-component system cell cycle sensor histidine kinase/response regulator CckA